MRKLVLATAAALTIASPAAARDGDFYAGFDLGAAISSKAEATFTPGAGAGTDGRSSFDTGLGYEGAVVIGYDLGAVRIEAEGSYKTAGVDSITSDFTVGTVAVAGTRDADGDIAVLSLIGNALLDFGNEDGLSFFAGGGAGWAQVSYKSLSAAAATSTMLDDDDSGFAWQLLGGARYRVGENVELTARYRFFNVPEIETTGFGGRAVSGDFQSHSLLAGVTFNLGSP